MDIFTRCDLFSNIDPNTHIYYILYTQIDMGNISEIHLNLEGAHRIYIISTNEYVYMRRNRWSWYPCFDVTQECLDVGPHATVRELWLDKLPLVTSNPGLLMMPSHVDMYTWDGISEVGIPALTSHRNV